VQSHCFECRAQLWGAGAADRRVYCLLADSDGTSTGDNNIDNINEYKHNDVNDNFNSTAYHFNNKSSNNYIYSNNFNKYGNSSVFNDSTSYNSPK